MPNISFDFVSSVQELVEDFKYESGVTPLSTPVAPFVTLVLYVSTFQLLIRRHGTLTKRNKHQDNIAAAEAHRAFWKPFNIVHNIFLSGGSFVTLAGTIAAYRAQISEEISASDLFVRVFCDPGEPLFDKLQFWLYVFYLSKFYELIDTFFLCVTMRRVIPLHWIHHLLTLMVFWIGLETRHTVMGVACVMNAAIHVVMYAYYAYKLVYPEFMPWWKKHLTNLQMRQFMVIVVGLGIWTYLDQFANKGCSGELWVIYFVFGVMVVFLSMFAAFSKETYQKVD
mmetsp:Transcript_32829/g.55833  ORF Transcript_32829/g.55833 Transcript_32829/m.55833 type:complete len:282 (+) Transcript_32829:256-1101(+)|eukprot:CAMPEP_0183728484 /NCGR_PEP_ID=MMETSP0737-20130205/28174_1 /TAXON_ID=385413 /ORGANISM="Thalassiosira miniscula, Strain CCMP1093" /LENGTH=281 /DNA_ID=CAMNT_0025960435 /DNA_START=241 /DNA_END=1086 /DNA_ORIENTATION=-